MSTVASEIARLMMCLLNIILIIEYSRAISSHENIQIQGVSVLCNICAHNSRIYNRTIHTTPKILDVDKVTSPLAHNGLY